MKIKCYFCKKEIPEEAASITSILYCSICPNCSSPDMQTTTTITAHKPEGTLLHMARIHFEYKEYHWVATYYLQEDRFSIHRMGKIDSEETFITTTLLKLPFLPNITPYNIITKMPTLITFS